MLLRSMPDLSPANRSFREWFYTRWGRENCLILGRSRHAEYARFRQRLSIKMARGGGERYFLDGRSVAVDDDSYLVLNDGRSYGSLIDTDQEVESFSIFFRPGLLEEVSSAMRVPIDDIPAYSHRFAGSIEFDEQLRPHDQTVSPVMRFIRHHILDGVDDDRWYEEQLHVLAARLLAQQHRTTQAVLRLDCAKASTRQELHRRVGLAADFMQSNYERDIGLDDIAAAACLSVHHFMRLFRRVHGMTPTQFLYRKRVQVALRLQQQSNLPTQDIASRVGFNSRATFYRQLKRWRGQGS
jgi:AraC-like DNA-binding protein